MLRSASNHKDSKLMTKVDKLPDNAPNLLSEHEPYIHNSIAHPNKGNYSEKCQTYLNFIFLFHDLKEPGG